MNAKIYNGNVQPNPKEYKIWVNDEGIIKTWNGTEWIEVAAGGSASGGSGESGGESDFSTPIYYETLIGADNAIIDLLAYPALIKTNIDGFTEFITSVQMFIYAQNDINLMQNIEAICFLPFRVGKNPTISLEDELGDNFSIFFKRRITKEEFYAI